MITKLNCGNNCFNMRGLVKQLNQLHDGHNTCLCYEFLIPLKPTAFWSGYFLQDRKF